MNSTAFIIGNTVISWSTIIFVLAIFAWFFFAASLYTNKKAKKVAVWIFFPLGTFFAMLLSRIVYWYSHQPQFDGFWDAVKSTDLAAFSILGVIPGLVLAAAVIRLMKFIPNLPGFLDALSPATGLGCALLYLTCLFNNSCRGKNLLTDPRFTKFPVGAVTMGDYGVEYRSAIYLAGFALMLFITGITLIIYHYNKKSRGITACYFLLFFSAAEFIIDSARYDAGYFPFNGFVSILQIFGAVAIMGVMVYFSVLTIRAAAKKAKELEMKEMAKKAAAAQKRGSGNRNRPIESLEEMENKHTGFPKVLILLWILELASFGATGYLEYLVQRHGDKATGLYALMSVSLFLMVLFPSIIRSIGKKEAAR